MYFFTVVSIVVGIAAIAPGVVEGVAVHVIVDEYRRKKEDWSKCKVCNPEDLEKTSPPSTDPKVDKEHATGIPTYDYSKMLSVPTFVLPDFNFVKVENKCGSIDIPADSKLLKVPTVRSLNSTFLENEKNDAINISTYDINKMLMVPTFTLPEFSFVKIENNYGSSNVSFEAISKICLPTDIFQGFKFIAAKNKHGLPIVLPGSIDMSGIENNSIIEKFYKSLKNGDKIEINGTLNFKLDGKLAAEQAKALKLHKD